MIHVMPCERVRDELPAFCDGELPVETQILIQSHLQECVACRLEAAEISELGDALRHMAISGPARHVNQATGRLTTAVLERIRVEQQLSFTTRIRGLFEDMHLIWAGLGASLAMLFCVFASAGVLQAASKERPDSLAGIISTIASADSQGPVRLAGSMLENSALLDTTAALPAIGDTDLMMAAVIARDGSIQNLELLAERAQSLHVKPEVMLAMLNVASRARFERGEDLQVPFNVLWLVTSTTVKGLPNYDLYLVTPPRWTSPSLRPFLPPKRPAPAVKLPTAGEDGLAAA